MRKLEILTSLDLLGLDTWQQLRATTHQTNDPFLDYGFLSGLEQHQCVGANTGWQPRHVYLSDERSPQAFMPLYLKDHSYGEFVFDWGWARSAQAAGIPYYPKLVSAIPYTPATGPRFLASSETLVTGLMDGLMAVCEETKASSWHLLFPDEDTTANIKAAYPQLNLLERRDCHFVWFNRNYQSFDDFLQTFNSRKRKNIKRERRRVAEQGVELQTLNDNAIEQFHIDAFYEFYQLTYHRRGQQPYLSHAFFNHLFIHTPKNLMLVIAQTKDQLVGAALFIVGDDTLYGRWWGGLPEFDCLHFEACYYQGIEYAIKKGLSRFDPGVQGEHKLMRGFEPEQTRSLHWIKNERLSVAVENWLNHERHHINQYQQQAREHLPFKPSSS